MVIFYSLNTVAMETSIIIDTSLTQEFFSDTFKERSRDLVIIRIAV